MHSSECTNSTACGLPDELLCQISTAFVDRDQCVRLALKLKLDQSEVCRWLDALFTDHMAYEIIKKWIDVRGQQATRLDLYTALSEVDEDMASTFEKAVFGRGRTVFP